PATIATRLKMVWSHVNAVKPTNMGAPSCAAKSYDRHETGAITILKPRFRSLLRRQHDQMIAERVLLICGRWKVAGKVLSHGADSAYEPIGRSAFADLLREIVNDRVPGALRHLGVDAGVRQDGSEALAYGDEDQHTRAAQRGV